MPWTELFSSTSADYSAVWNDLPAADCNPDIRKIRGGNTRQTFLVQFEGEPLVVKHWWIGRLKDRIRSFYKKPDARHELELTCKAVDKGCYCARPLSYAEHRVAGFLKRACLIHPQLPSTTTASDFFKPPEIINHPLALSVIDLFGRKLAQTHVRGLFHNDYKLDNVIVERAADAIELHIIDWGLSREIPPESREACWSDLVSGYRSLSTLMFRFGKATSNQFTTAFLKGYAEAGHWFATDYDRHVESLKKRVEERTVVSSQRQWKRAFSPARRRFTGKEGNQAYIAFSIVREEDVKAAVSTDSGPLVRVDHPRAQALWRAANVLKCLGMDPAGIVGICSDKRGWAPGQLLVLRSRMHEPVDDILPRALQYCQFSGPAEPDRHLTVEYK